MAGRRGSVCVPSSAERKYLTEKAIRLIAPKLNVSGREAWVFVSFGTQKVISYARNVTPPYGVGLPKVIPRGRWGGFFAIAKEPEQPPGGRASGEAGGRTRPADSRREAVGRPARPCEGGPDGGRPTRPGGAVAGRSRGGRVAGCR
jgi:hypothetical protein